MDVSYIFISLEIVSAMSPWLSPLQIAILPLIVLFQLKLLSSNVKYPARKGYQRFFMPGIVLNIRVPCQIQNLMLVFKLGGSVEKNTLGLEHVSLGLTTVRTVIPLRVTLPLQSHKDTNPLLEFKQSNTSPQVGN